MKKKVKVVANYDNDFNIYKSVLNSSIKEFKNFELTYDDFYDLLFIINGYKGKINTDKKNIIGLLQEPINNINYDRNLHFYCDKIFCQSSDMFNKYKKISEQPLNMFHSGHVSIPLKSIIEKENKKDKEICIIMSGLTSPNNPSWKNHNYIKRQELLRQIINSDLDIDIFGRGLNINDRRYKGEIASKHDILKSYKYSIAIENCCEKNYVSEKFFDCLLNDCIPLYYGCPNVESIYNNCYLALDLDNQNIIADIKQKISSDNSHIYINLLEAKQKYINMYTVASLIERVIDEKNIN